MPLRPIDAIFVHPQKRFYVVYYRGELWQLPRMKIDMTSWQNRTPYKGEKRALYLTQSQQIADLTLAAQLRTLQLPDNIHGCHLPKFEDWWETHGYTWLKNKLLAGESPLAGNAMMTAKPSTNPTNTKSASAKVAAGTNATPNSATKETVAEAEKPQPSTVEVTTPTPSQTTTTEPVKKSANNTDNTDNKQNQAQQPHTEAQKVTSSPLPAEPVSETPSVVSKTETQTSVKTPSQPQTKTGNIFDDMLAELTDEILNGE